MSGRLRIGFSAVASIVAVLVGTTPVLALSERDANTINQKMIKAKFIASYVHGGLQNLPSRLEADVCHDMRAARPDMAPAVKLAREALALIGPDMMSESKEQRDTLNTIIKLDIDMDATLEACVRDGL